MIEDISKIKLDGLFVAEVRNNVDPDNEGKITVFIPRLMYQNEYDEKPFEEINKVNLDEELIINAEDFKDKELELEESNYLWARPLAYYEDNVPNWKYEEKYYNSGTLRVPRIGSIVIVIFLDSDLQKCYYLPISPTTKNNKIDSFNCIKPENYNNPETRQNIDVIRMYWDGCRIEVDTNSHEIKLAVPNGNYIKLSNKDIEIKGDTHIIGELTVDKDAFFKQKVTIDDLVTCKDDLVVQKFIYNRVNLTTHTHGSACGGTTQPR